MPREKPRLAANLQSNQAISLNKQHESRGFKAFMSVLFTKIYKDRAGKSIERLLNH
jgi:hypothetical protein